MRGERGAEQTASGALRVPETAHGGCLDCVPPLAGFMITHVGVDDSLTLSCRNGDGIAARLRIDGDIKMLIGGIVRRLGAEGDPAALGPVLGFVFRRIDGACLLDDGSIELSLGDDRLTACASEHFVAWELTRGPRYHAICLAGGKVMSGERSAAAG